MSEANTKRKPWLGSAVIVATFAMGAAFGLVLTAEIGAALYIGATLLIFALCLAGLTAGRRAHQREMAEIDAIDVELYDRMDRIERTVAARRSDGKAVPQ